MELAHFFWHGKPLSIYELACIRSFVIQGFSVNVWSYDAVALPAGATAQDASEILPRSDLTRYTQNGKPKNIAAFTDFFRFELLSRYEGWWFDTDVLCLQPASAFAIFQQRLVVGYESDDVINGAVLRVNDQALSRDLKDRADAIALAGNDSFSWGAVGPGLITALCKEPGQTHQPVAPGVFYPIGWTEADVVLDPTRRNEAVARCSGALCYHIWNEVLNRAAIPKSLMPPNGSYLYEQFVAVEPALAQMETLPYETFDALFSRIKPQEDPGFVFYVRQLWPSLVRAVRKRL